MNYEELVEALRWCSVDEYVPCTGCPMNEETHGTGCFNIMHQRAAAAIEALNRLVYLNTERCEALRKQLGEAHENYEKHLSELEAQLPKRGEMYFLEYDNPETGEFEQTYFQCSVCGKYFYGVDECEAKDFNYCPNCGSQMRGEVNERD